jgi:transposase
MQSSDLYQQILGLRSPWSVSTVEMDEAKEEIHIYLKHSSSCKFGCPQCQVSLPVYDHVKERTWRHLDTCQMKTIIHAEPPRVDCLEHKVHQVHLPWCEPGSGFTAMFERLSIDMMSFMSKTRAATILRVSLASLIGIRDRAVARGLARRAAEKKAGTHRVLRHGCVDEKSWRKGRKFGTVICNVEANTVEEVYEGRAGDGLSVFYKALGDKGRSQIESMSQDFHEGFWRVTLDNLEQGREAVVFDRFHLMMHVNDALAATHRKEASQARLDIERGKGKSPTSKAGRAAVTAQAMLEEIKGARWLMVRSLPNMTDAQVEKIAWVEGSYYESAEAWRLKEELRDMWQCQTVEEAAEWLSDWCQMVVKSGVSAMQKVGKLVEKYAWGILNGFRMGRSNSPAETMNSKIQTIRAKARGHRNFEAFKNDVLFHLGGLSLYPKLATT